MMGLCVSAGSGASRSADLIVAVQRTCHSYERNNILLACFFFPLKNLIIKNVKLTAFGDGSPVSDSGPEPLADVGIGHQAFAHRRGSFIDPQVVHTAANKWLRINI